MSLKTGNVRSAVGWLLVFVAYIAMLMLCICNIRAPTTRVLSNPRVGSEVPPDMRKGNS